MLRYYMNRIETCRGLEVEIRTTDTPLQERSNLRSGRHPKRQSSMPWRRWGYEQSDRAVLSIRSRNAGPSSLYSSKAQESKAASTLSQLSTPEVPEGQGGQLEALLRGRGIWRGLVEIHSRRFLGSRVSPLRGSQLRHMWPHVVSIGHLLSSEVRPSQHHTTPARVEFPRWERLQPRKIYQPLLRSSCTRACLSEIE